MVSFGDANRGIQEHGSIYGYIPSGIYFSTIGSPGPFCNTSRLVWFRIHKSRTLLGGDTKFQSEDRRDLEKY